MVFTTYDLRKDSFCPRVDADSVNSFEARLGKTRIRDVRFDFTATSQELATDQLWKPAVLVTTCVHTNAHVLSEQWCVIRLYS